VALLREPQESAGGGEHATGERQSKCKRAGNFRSCAGIVRTARAEIRSLGGNVNFDHPMFLLALLGVPALWLWMRRSPGISTTCLALKCAAFAAMVLALADPFAALRMSKVAVTVLMD